ncbi:MAG: hypothetical protein A3J25_03885 [Pseudomonadales bacterium RIFCSPLOWO2_02_FULL_63_210]|nr:MAG: hypothetical protein A3J25_03885 [Pseudomonadales bacterium RIFCSPLOWO2_02_FULL_63_210]
MKDSNDKQTLYLLDKPRRGRPSTGKAKTQAQIQREYRARKKSTLEQLPTLAQALAGFEVWYLPKGCRKWRKSSGHEPLSWAAAHAHARCLTLAGDMVGPGFEEHGARVEIRPVQVCQDDN